MIAKNTTSRYCKIVICFIQVSLFLGYAETCCHAAEVQPNQLLDSLANIGSTNITSTDTSLNSESARTSLVDTSIIVPTLDFTNTPIFDALTAISRSYNLSVFIDTSVTGNLTLRLNHAKLNDALLLIIRENNLRWSKSGGILEIYKLKDTAPKVAPLDITFSNGLVSMNLKSADLSRLVDTLIDLTGRNIVLEDHAKGPISGKIVNLELDKALMALLSPNGYSVSSVDKIIYIGIDNFPKQSTSKAKNLAVSCDGGLVTAEFSNAPLTELLSNLGSKCGLSIVLQTKIEGTVSASMSKISLEDALINLLISTAYTFRISNGTIIVGNRDSESLSESKLIKFNQLIASAAEALIPASLSKQVVIKVVKEHNGLVLTGPRTAIAQVELFLSAIDVPIAQVLFEVLVVDYNTTNKAEFGIFANNFGGDSTRKETYYPNVDLNRNGNESNSNLNSWSRYLGISNLGILPSNFYLRLKAMVQQGKANIRSQPQIAALNGHSASIKIGTTQYYLLQSQTVYPSQQPNVSTQTSQRFEKIEADMSLEVTPFVNVNGDLTVEVNPEFSSPVGVLNPDVPPTINRRELHSTVRLKNGETIVLGGLVETEKTATIDKVPVLGSIPIIGRIFQNRGTLDRTSNLMIYITPHVYFGSEGSVQLDSLYKKK